MAQASGWAKALGAQHASVAAKAGSVARHSDWLSTECPGGGAFAEVFDTAIRQRVIDGWR